MMSYKYSSNASTKAPNHPTQPGEWFKEKKGAEILKVVDNAKCIEALNTVVKFASTFIKSKHHGQHQEDHEDLARLAADLITVMFFSCQRAETLEEWEQMFQNDIETIENTLYDLKKPNSLDDQKRVQKFRTDLHQALRRFAVPLPRELDTLAKMEHGVQQKLQRVYRSMSYMEGAENIKKKNVKERLGMRGRGEFHAYKGASDVTQIGGSTYFGD